MIIHPDNKYKLEYHKRHAYQHTSFPTLKEAAERMVIQAGGVSLRLANLYGAGCGIDLGIDGAVERFTRVASTGGTITLYGDGSQEIDYVHVDDVAQAFYKSALSSAVGVFNVGGGDPVTIRTLAEKCVALGSEFGTLVKITSTPAPRNKVWPDRSLRIDRAAELLFWKPETALKSGLREMIEMRMAH